MKIKYKILLANWKFKEIVHDNQSKSMKNNELAGL